TTDYVSRGITQDDTQLFKDMSSLATVWALSWEIYTRTYGPRTSILATTLTAPRSTSLGESNLNSWVLNGHRTSAIFTISTHPSTSVRIMAKCLPRPITLLARTISTPFVLSSSLRPTSAKRARPLPG